MFWWKLTILCIPFVIGWVQAACPNAYFMAKHFDQHLPDDTESAYEVARRSDIYRNYSGRGPAPRHTIFLTGGIDMRFYTDNGNCIFASRATRYDCGPLVIRGRNDWSCWPAGQARAQHSPVNGHYVIGGDLDAIGVGK